MQQQTLKVPKREAVGTGVLIDLLRTQFMSRITMTFMDEILREGAPEEVQGKLSGAAIALHKFNEAVSRLMPKHDATWLSKLPNSSVLYDMSLVIDLMAKVHTQSGQEQYSEFLQLIISSLQSVIYAQGKNKRIYFNKYKALFELVAKELKADTDRRPGQVLYENKQLYISTTVPLVEQEVK